MSEMTKHIQMLEFMELLEWLDHENNVQLLNLHIENRTPLPQTLCNHMENRTPWPQTL